jgi:transcriptional antiterminator RfaH
VIPCCEAQLNPSVKPLGERWYAVYTDAAKEFRTKDDLVSQGFRMYLTCLKRWDHHGKRRGASARNVCIRPLFPRYLFVLIDLGLRSSSVREIRDTDGAVGVLCNADRPMRVPEALITGLQVREAAGEYDETKPKPKVPRFSPGDRVVVQSGPLAQFLGQIKSLRGHERVAVLLQFMGGVTAVELPLDTVAKV